jgi:hypothetical protein
VALVELYNGRTVDRDTNGISTTITYSGTKAECDTWAAAQTVGATYPGLGKLSNTSVSQLEGAIYSVSARYQNANGDSGASGSEVVPPDYSFGEYSASMNCSMLSTPLEQHPNYRTCWNYFLAARDDASTNPQWWPNITTPVITGANAELYRFLSSPSELPIGKDDSGHSWAIVKNPVLPGVQSYDRALYTQTESARFRKRTDAVSSIAQYANKIGTPINDPGSPFVSGKWKCDNASVTWNNEYWLATLTWTYSPDGWSSLLYDAVSS